MHNGVFMDLCMGGFVDDQVSRIRMESFLDSKTVINQWP